MPFIIRQNPKNSVATFKGGKHVVAVEMSFNSPKFFISRAESAMQFFISFFFYIMLWLKAEQLNIFSTKIGFLLTDGDIENNRHAMSKMLQLMSVNIIITLNIK